jgi:hypothetical protein
MLFGGAAPDDEPEQPDDEPEQPDDERELHARGLQSVEGDGRRQRFCLERLFSLEVEADEAAALVDAGAADYGPSYDPPPACT